VVVSEAGASVYSASAFASEELPGLDVSLRGAVSIARRLQDPLAELVKIDPQSIGVGQYQHDLGEHKLSRSLDAVVEDCVNAMGVDVNTASTPLLSRVSGIGEGLARSIVSHREAYGPFRNRAVLKKVPRLGPKAFELSAGFLRIRNGDDPLDASGVHPEAYPIVRRILAATKSQLERRIGDTPVLRQLRPEAFTDAVFGVPTVIDILRELGETRTRSAPGFQDGEFSRGGGKARGSEARHWFSKVSSLTSPRSAPLSMWGSTRTGWCTSPRWPMLTSRIHAKLRSPAMSCMSRCWRSTRSAVGFH
jgi:protein Tex